MSGHSITARGEETRARILETALHLFRERGFDETTMRQIATEAGVATGAAYYYYKSKNDLVMDFYLETAEEMRARLPEILESSRSFRVRVEAIIDAKFEQFRDHRRLLTALFRTGVDPRNPLSPFGEETREIREDAIALFSQAMDSSTTKVPDDLARYLPRLLWLYQMSMILFWIFDTTKTQKRTRILLAGTLDIIMKLISLSTVPVLGRLRRRVIVLLDELEATS